MSPPLVNFVFLPRHSSHVTHTSASFGHVSQFNFYCIFGDKDAQIYEIMSESASSAIYMVQVGRHEQTLVGCVDFTLLQFNYVERR